MRHHKHVWKLKVNLSFSLRPGLGQEGLKVGFNVNIFHKTFQKIEKWLATVCIYNWNFDERWHRIQNIKYHTFVPCEEHGKMFKIFYWNWSNLYINFFISIHGDNRLIHHLIKTFSQRICRKNMAGYSMSNTTKNLICFDYIHNVHPPFLLEVEPSTKFLKRGAWLDLSQFLEGVCWERGKWLFSGGVAVLI